jgi:hypothetical protein
MMSVSLYFLAHLVYPHGPRPCEGGPTQGLRKGELVAGVGRLDVHVVAGVGACKNICVVTNFSLLGHATKTLLLKCQACELFSEEQLSLTAYCRR